MRLLQEPTPGVPVRRLITAAGGFQKHETTRGSDAQGAVGLVANSSAAKAHFPSPRPSFASRTESPGRVPHGIDWPRGPRPSRAQRAHSGPSQVSGSGLAARHLICEVRPLITAQMSQDAARTGHSQRSPALGPPSQQPESAERAIPRLAWRRPLLRMRPFG